MNKHFSFKWYDMWVGVFYDTKKHHLYVCPLPCCVLEFWRGDKHAEGT